MYRVVLSSHYRRAFKKLNSRDQKRIDRAVSLLVDDPFLCVNIESIKGVREKAFRLRVGRYRVVYFVITKDFVVEVLGLFLKKGKEDYQM